MALAARQCMLEAVHEERTVGEVRHGVMERLLAEAVTEAGVLHRHARLRREGIEQMQIVVVEGSDTVHTIGDDQRPEQHALTLQQRRHRIGESLRAQPFAEHGIRRRRRDDQSALGLVEQRDEAFQMFCAQHGVNVVARAARRADRAPRHRAGGHRQQ